MNDLVSVIMPTHNIVQNKDLFKKSINSILNQTHKNVELIIVDDKSQDKSVEHIKEYLEKDIRIKAIQLKKNVGPGIARNMGFQISSGQYVTFQDADDCSMLDRFEKLLAEMPDYGVITSSLLMKYPGASRRRIYGEDFFDNDVESGKAKARLHFSSALMTRDLYEKFGGMEHYKFSSDSLIAIKMVYFMKMTGTTDTIKSLDEVLFHWVRRTNSITMHSSTKGKITSLQKEQREPLKSVLSDIKNGRIVLPISEEDAIRILNIKNNIKCPNLKWDKIKIDEEVIS